MKPKNDLDYFQKDDWWVRLAVLVFHRAFLLALVALIIWGCKEGLPASIFAGAIKKFM